VQMRHQLVTEQEQQRQKQREHTERLFHITNVSRKVENT
jgi:hypothetical protein